MRLGLLGQEASARLSHFVQQRFGFDEVLPGHTLNLTTRRAQQRLGVGRHPSGSLWFVLSMSLVYNDARIGGRTRRCNSNEAAFEHSDTGQSVFDGM